MGYLICKSCPNNVACGPSQGVWPPTKDDVGPQTRHCEGEFREWNGRTQKKAKRKKGMGRKEGGAKAVLIQRDGEGKGEL